MAPEKLPKEIRLTDGFAFFPTVRNDSLKYWYQGEDGTCKGYLFREDARRIAKELLDWADSEEVPDAEG